MLQLERAPARRPAAAAARIARGAGGGARDAGGGARDRRATCGRRRSTTWGCAARSRQLCAGGRAQRAWRSSASIGAGCRARARGRDRGLPRGAGGADERAAPRGRRAASSSRSSTRTAASRAARRRRRPRRPRRRAEGAGMRGHARARADGRRRRSRSARRAGGGTQVMLRCRRERRRRGSCSPTTTRWSAAGLRLVLDAEPDLRVVAEAGDGAEAVEAGAAASESTSRCSTSAMPRLTGLQAARELARRRPGLRVLMLSMHDSEQYLFEALKAGASGYVLKSGADRDLVDACRAALRGEPFLYPAAVTRADRATCSPAPEAPPRPAHPARARGGQADRRGAHERADRRSCSTSARAPSSATARTSWASSACATASS